MTVITIGELVVDWLAEKPGQSLTESGNFYRCLGGNALNVAIGLARLGSSVRVLGKLGEDVDGLYLTKVLEQEGVDTGAVIRSPDYHTAQCYCMTGLDGEHMYFNWPKTNAARMFEPEDISPEQFEGAAFLHATGISFEEDPRRAAVRKAIEIALELNLIVSFDACYPTGDEQARLSTEDILSRVHILKLNYPELVVWSGGSTKDSVGTLARRLFSKFRPVVMAVTLGAEGSLLITENDEIECPPYSVDTVDGVGAGDGYIAGLLHSLSKTMASETGPDPLRRLAANRWLSAGLFANAVGALVTRKVGSFEGLPRREEVLSLTGQPK